MAQERTINDLIILALYQINAVGVGENIDAFMQQTGLEVINLLLDSFTEAAIYIPFKTQIDFVMNPGQDIYTVSEVIDADIGFPQITELTFANYAMGTATELRYPIRIIDEASYFNNLRISTLESTPSYVFFDNQQEFSTLTFYPKPNIAYPVSLQAKCYFEQVELFTPIQGVPRAFHEFFRYHLARNFKDFYPSSQWTEDMEREYINLEERVSAQELNMTIEPSMTLRKNVPWIYPTILAMP